MLIRYFKILLSFLLKLFGEKIFVNSVKIFSASIKSINPIEKYPHVTESCACILKVFVIIFLFLINAIISFGICSIPKPSNK